MGSGKKEAARRERQGKNNDGMGNVRVKVCMTCHSTPYCQTNSCSGRELLQRCKESSYFEPIKGWEATAKLHRKDHKSRIISVKRYTKCQDRAKPKMVYKLQSNFSRNSVSFQRSYSTTNLRSQYISPQVKQASYEFDPR